jgi:hypothetical protein
MSFILISHRLSLRMCERRELGIFKDLAGIRQTDSVGCLHLDQDQKQPFADRSLLNQAPVPLRNAVQNTLGIPAMQFNHNHLCCCGRIIRGLYY